MEPAFRSLVCRIGHNLRINGGANDLPVDLPPKMKEVNDVLVNASTYELDLDLICIPGEKRVIQCKYPRCNNGKILWRHIFICSGNNCLICDSMRHSDCVIPRCSEFKERIRQKERKVRVNEKRLRRLRKKERELKRIYDSQSVESQLAAATACPLSLKEGQGDRSETRMANGSRGCDDSRIL